MADGRSGADRADRTVHRPSAPGGSVRHPHRMTPQIALDAQLWDALGGATMQPYGYPSDRWPEAMGGATEQDCQELYELVRDADTSAPLQVPDHLRTALLNVTTAVLEEVDIDIPVVVFYGDRDPYEVGHRLAR